MSRGFSILKEHRMRLVPGQSLLAACLTAAFLMTVPIPPAQAQVDSREGIALQNQIYQLRQELRLVQDQTARGQGSSIRPPAVAPPQQLSSSNDLLAQLLTRVDALEEQVRQLRGQIDETQNQVQRQNQDISKRIDDLAFQMNAPQSNAPRPRANTQPADRGDPLPTPTIPAPPTRQLAASAPRTPEAVLRDGNTALTRRDYAAAEADAREVLTNRTSARAYDAKFLLAEALAGQRQFTQAAVAYDDAYNHARTGSHAQEARLGLASSLTAINEKKAACDVLVHMRAEFPQLRPEVSTGMATTSQKAGCR